MKKLIKVLISTIILFIVYILMVEKVTPDEIITGSIMALLISVTYPVIVGEKLIKWFNPKRYIYLLIYIPVFLWEMIKANFDVARRVVTPSLPIAPGIVKIRTKLKSSTGKLILANSITLTPGTLTIDIVNDYLYIHWIEVKDKDIEKSTKDIAAKFEKYLEVIFD